MSDFFVQQVYLNEIPYTAKDGQNKKKVGGYINNITYGSSSAGGNNGKLKENTFKRNNIDVTENIVFFQNEAWGGKFNFHCSEGNLDLGESNYVIKRIGDYYYLGFDFQTDGNNANQIVERDYIYNDIILKIVPAKYKNARRIMAEDLSVDSNSDFDFNDVVFDAAIIDGEAVITLQAVGGTLPLCVGDESHEVHDLFGVGMTKFVNTQSKGEKAPVMFRIPYVNSLKDIKIIVDNIDISAIQIGNKNMHAPAKLCCPTDYKWADERKSIDEFFPNFKNAVGDSDELWYKDGAKEWQ